ncbi:RNA polymerase sigma factor [Kriegella aquimaris]|uniref:RNA polymerase sigma-70 factor, ECF subfamily n=1 Tax=Kriegella aquimaris TaxID=192904 RepID=A0A1G9TMI6_9FLAO|nr:RNA polymerase sigma-70 factor [Kriegella aquimaris]SDM48634.1 RNA polymerase sigma-70 factor, ECF subfamily [Kriegella aquimaris]
MNEVEAVIAMKRGDRSAFKYLFTTYYSRLVAYITTYTHDKFQSEDIVQHAFIRFWEDKSKLDETKSPKGYLYAIAYNRYIDTIKKTKKQEKLLDQIWERALIDRIEEDSEMQEMRIQKMKEIIETLPPKCRKIIQMNKVQGIGYKEIAAQMGISIKTVESQMRIAFTKIREAFKNDSVLLFVLFEKFRNGNK